MLLILKLVLAPALVVLSTLAGRRWGSGVTLMPADPPATADGPPDSAPWPWWDLPARATATIVLVLMVTGAAEHLGPSLTGVLAPFPIATSVVAAFALSLRGYPATVALLKGVLRGLIGFATFCFLVATLVVPAGPVPAFTGALAGALVVQLIVRAAASRTAGASVPEPVLVNPAERTPG